MTTTTSTTIERGRMHDVFALAEAVGPYEEWPLLPASIDPQVTVSRNDRPQPFYVAYDHDTCLVHMAGEAVIRFRSSSINEFDLVAGDYVYVPAGVLHRIEPATSSVQLRFHGNEDHAEEALFTCPSCDRELFRTGWHTSDTLPQEGFTTATRTYNAGYGGQPCQSCTATAPVVPIDEYRWAHVSATIRAAVERKDAGDGTVSVPTESDVASMTDLDRDRPPMRSNVFWSVMHLNTQLGPIFPELGPGAIVPCASLMVGHRAAFSGRFFHQNSVEEVIIVHGASPGGRGRPGLVMVESRQHKVENRLADIHDPDQFAVTVITQRQERHATQRESFLLRCDNCNHLLLRRDVDAAPPTRTEPLPALLTIELSASAVADFNSDEAIRTCSKCGTVNEPFDLEDWGWDRYTRRQRAARMARQSQLDAAASTTSAPAGRPAPDYAHS